MNCSGTFSDDGQDSKRCRSKGQGLVEFAFVLPFLIIFFLCISEFGHLIIKSHRIATASREAAGAALKDCGFLPWPPPPTNQAAIDTCLNNVQQEVTTYATKMIPDSPARGAIMVSLYGVNPTTGALELKGISPPGGTANGFTTRYNVGNVNTELFPQQLVIAYGEAFYRHYMITPIKALLDFAFPDEIYQVAIF